MSKIFRRKIRTEKGHSKEYDGLLYIRNRVLSLRVRRDTKRGWAAQRRD